MTDKFVFDAGMSWRSIFDFAMDIVFGGGLDKLEIDYYYKGKKRPCGAVIYSSDIDYYTTNGLKDFLGFVFFEETEELNWTDDPLYTAFDLCLTIQDKLNRGERIEVKAFWIDD